eukprot:scaffold345_cov44-Attheya_sp.AAC.1
MLKEGEDEHDLSPYEQLRLQKIRRNAARLAELGLDCSMLSPLPIQIQQQTKKRRPKEKRPPTRFSKRLRQQQQPAEKEPGVVTQKRKEEEACVVQQEPTEQEIMTMDYTRYPHDPEELDDHEFEAFVSLRKWRLAKKNELEVEAYKICQNRTICEVIRRVRNDPSWGVVTLDRKRDVTQDLLECWGLGPSKVKPGGYGCEMRTILEQEENQQHLAASRTNDETKMKRIKETDQANLPSSSNTPSKK